MTPYCLIFKVVCRWASAKIVQRARPTKYEVKILLGNEKTTKCTENCLIVQKRYVCRRPSGSRSLVIYATAAEPEKAK